MNWNSSLSEELVITVAISYLLIDIRYSERKFRLFEFGAASFSRQVEFVETRGQILYFRVGYFSRQVWTVLHDN
jgi:hypothetical protein